VQSILVAAMAWQIAGLAALKSGGQIHAKVKEPILRVGPGQHGDSFLLQWC